MNRKGHPALIHLHPREFDLNCPRLPLAKRFVLNTRIERTGKRLHRLLNDFYFHFYVIGDKGESRREMTIVSFCTP
jgi:hypothetical protein